MHKSLSLLFLCPLITFAQVKEPWINKPLSDWPPIALINQVLYKNGDRYVDPSFKYAGTGFLIENGKDTLAATAKHILWIAKNKKVNGTEVNAELNRWVMTPKGNHTDSALVDKLLNEDTAERLEGNTSTILERDWLIFSLKKSSPKLYPLKPRYTPVKPGEKVYILSNAYEDSASTVYNGTVYRKLGMDILIRHNMGHQKPGSSGSPVIDANGYLIGIISSGTTIDVGEVAVAISTEYLKDVLDKKPALNRPKKDYGELIFNTTMEHGAARAILQYKSLTKNPDNYYIYNLRSANRNGLFETGQRLLDMKRYRDAIKILKFNIKARGRFYRHYNLLAKAQLLAGNKQEALKSYRMSIQSYDSEENEAYDELEKIK
ncbi:MAG: trypsin-like peptidase domain-containing protein [Daejeonella sp.]|uniref:trypsin-like peptidase domain-containing protein n=1 Tax=Daejeonella sp. JGW-45 TaxID=3034148 RepID=UPI0023EB26B4|nr:trypsin-like peptidase domain-containing protein [Daejeonella sp. JGW-45]